MQFIKKHFFNLLLVLLVAFVAVTKGPTIFNNFKAQKSKPAPENIERLSGEIISFPVEGQKKLVLFWMINCAPCRAEMQRIDELVGLGVLRGDDVIAINFVDPKDQVLAYLQQHPFQYVIALDHDGKIADKYKVISTPTIFLFNSDGTLEWATSGISPTLSFRIKNFFAKGI